MKRKNLFFLGGVFSLFLLGCSPKTIIVGGNITNVAGFPIVYSVTKDGVFNATRMDTLRFFSDSTYRLEIPASGNEKITFFLYAKGYIGTAYLAPGYNKLDIDASGTGKLRLKNNLIKENQIMQVLSGLENNVFYLRARLGDHFNIENDTIASSVYRKLTAYASQMEKKIADTDGWLYNAALQDIRMQLLLAFMNQYFIVNSRHSEQTKQEWKQIYPEMLKFADINRPENVFSSAFAEVIANVVGIEVYMQKNESAKDANSHNRTLFEWYKNHLQGRAREVAMGHIFLEDKARQKYATEVPVLYDEFKKLYPESVLLPDIDRAVQENKIFNHCELPEGVNILHTDSVRTLKEITDLYRGKVIFLDIWATWCGPCRKSFAFVKPLQRYAQENNIVLLYLSLDKPQSANLWKKMAGYYHLWGEHVIINESFKEEIYDTFGKNGALGIPHCAIMNKSGEWQYKSAESPENMEKLIRQLEKAAL